MAGYTTKVPAVFRFDGVRITSDMGVLVMERVAAGSRECDACGEAFAVFAYVDEVGNAHHAECMVCVRESFAVRGTHGDPDVWEFPVA